MPSDIVPQIPGQDEAEDSISGPFSDFEFKEFLMDWAHIETSDKPGWSGLWFQLHGVPSMTKSVENR